MYRQRCSKFTLTGLSSDLSAFLAEDIQSRWQLLTPLSSPLLRRDSSGLKTDPGQKAEEKNLRVETNGITLPDKRSWQPC